MTHPLSSKQLVLKALSNWINKCKEYNMGSEVLDKVPTDILANYKLNEEQLKVILNLVKSAYSSGCEDQRAAGTAKREIV